MSYTLNYEVPKKPEGTWMIYVREDEDGSMWVGYGFEEIRVNNCPFTGTPAKKQMTINYAEKKDLEGNTYFFKKLTN